MSCICLHYASGHDTSNLIKLQNGKGFVRKQIKCSAILRYYLNYSNDEDLARGLLILFKPFRNEMKEIHTLFQIEQRTEEVGLVCIHLQLIDYTTLSKYLIF